MLFRSEELSEADAQSTFEQLGSDYVLWLGFQGLYQQLLRDAPDLRALNTELGLA